MAGCARAWSGENGEVMLSWDPVGERPPTGYRILMQTDGRGPYDERPQERRCRTSDVTSCVLEGLSVGSSYKFKVVALYGDGTASGSSATNPVTPNGGSSWKCRRDMYLEEGSPASSRGDQEQPTPRAERPLSRQSWQQRRDAYLTSEAVVAVSEHPSRSSEKPRWRERRDEYLSEIESGEQRQHKGNISWRERRDQYLR
eukprot:TRINITY_DN19170_c0_g1_i1.p1 TRINITY_DN19170_c0_g1~~TRINITY_DN19170_c0_g1_i1.p1  ORF type:complete len:200 (-),score=23.92 TRINITY_DN19170_c0_g1_i1:528-1127(-)